MITRVKTKILQQLEERRTLTSKISLRDPWILLATWFGSSMIWIGSGTWGTFFTIPVAVPILYWGGGFALMAFIALVSVLGWKASAEFEKKTGAHDCSLIVIDEVAGYSITLLAIPEVSLFWVAVSFLVFRIIDTLKPWPISILDTQVEGATGVMVDDIAAGVASALMVMGLAYAGLG